MKEMDGRSMKCRCCCICVPARAGMRESNFLFALQVLDVRACGVGITFAVDNCRVFLYGWRETEIYEGERRGKAAVVSGYGCRLIVRERIVKKRAPGIIIAVL